MFGPLMNSSAIWTHADTCWAHLGPSGPMLDPGWIQTYACEATVTYEAHSHDYGVKQDATTMNDWSIIRKEAWVFILSKTMCDAFSSESALDQVALRTAMLPVQNAMKEQQLDPLIFNVHLIERYKAALRMR
jgi:hypothetical protein